MGEAARALDVPTGSVRSYFSRNTQKPFKGQYKLSKI
jgi:DNA-directed RNA polymerase specialized sigma24 family protein